MKNVRELLLQNLTPRQRLIAAMDASSRNDDNELKRLQETTPMRSYTGPDPAYRRTWETITALGLAIECDLRGYALTWGQAVRLNDMEAAHAIVEKMHSIERHSRVLLGELGITGPAIEGASPERHFCVKTLLSLAEGGGDDPDIEAMFEKIREYIPLCGKAG